MFLHEQLRSLIITPALSKLQLYSNDAEELLVFTCAAESDGGTYLKQIKGPALGIYQMEPKTYNDIWQNYIRNRRDLTLLLTHNFDVVRMPDENRMVYDLHFATAMARIHYCRVKEALPSAKDVEAIWNYYKTYYNTPSGKATKSKAIKAYETFIKKVSDSRAQVRVDQPQQDSVIP